MNSQYKAPQIIFWFFLGCLLVLGSMKSAYSESIVQIVKKNLKSVVTIIAVDKNSQPMSLGSGFFINKQGDVATNAHVVKGAYRVIVRWKGKNKTSRSIKRFDKRFDLAVIDSGHVNVPSVSLGDSEVVQVGEKVLALGNPHGLEGTVSDGILSGIRQLEKVRYLQITAPISPGSSGGPVLNSSGRIIGIATASYLRGQNLNFAVPVNYLKKLARVNLSFKDIQKEFREAKLSAGAKKLVQITYVNKKRGGTKYRGKVHSFL